MNSEFKGISGLTKRFSSDKVCREYLEKLRWNGKPVCPKCGHDVIYRFSDGKTYKCKDCKKRFSVTVGTVMENTKIPLTQWVIAIYLFTSHKKGVSSLQIAKHLCVTQKTGWFILHRIREMMKDKNQSPLQNEVEADEAYFGGKVKNMSKHRQKLRKEQGLGSGVAGKTAVSGQIERGGKVKLTVVNDTEKNTLQVLLTSTVSKDAIVITDEHRSYIGLDSHFTQHHVVEHGNKEYVRGKFHTNNIENVWSHFKRGVYGIYHFNSRKHLQRYCDEFAFRHNSRLLVDWQRFYLSLSQCNGRIKYKDLIAA